MNTTTRLKKTLIEDQLFTLMSIVATTLAIVIGGVIIYSTLMTDTAPVSHTEIVTETVTDCGVVG